MISSILLLLIGATTSLVGASTDSDGIFTSNADLQGLLGDLGAHVELHGKPGDDSQVNLLARFGPADGEGGLLMAGHTDTVPWDESMRHARSHVLFSLTSSTALHVKSWQQRPTRCRSVRQWQRS